MNKDQYLEFHRSCCDKMVAITAAKNSDYTGSSLDPFANFRRVEVFGVTDTSRGFLVRMIDKVSRIISYVQKGILLVKDESVEDTLIDLANYCILMAGYLRSEKLANAPAGPKHERPADVYTDDIPAPSQSSIVRPLIGDHPYLKDENPKLPILRDDYVYISRQDLNGLMNNQEADMISTDTAQDISSFLTTEVGATGEQVAIENGKPLTDKDLSPLAGPDLVDPYRDLWGLS